jgi:hypothetical protein
MIARMPHSYILVDRVPVRAPSMEAWAQQTCERVALATWRDAAGEEVAKVSTMFLGLDHAFGDGPLEVFETMVFWRANPRLDEWCERCATWEEAEAQHERACALVREAFDEPLPGAGRGDEE